MRLGVIRVISGDFSMPPAVQRVPTGRILSCPDPPLLDRLAADKTSPVGLVMNSLMCACHRLHGAQSSQSLLVQLNSPQRIGR